MSYAAQAMLRKVEGALRQNFEGPTAQEIRDVLIVERDKALGPDHFDANQAITLSHAIAHLARLLDVEAAMRPKGRP